MGKLILAVAMLLLFSTGAAAQTVEASETKLLQDQVASLIKARGEDQKALLELRSQFAQLAGRVPDKPAEESAKESRAALEASCKRVKMKISTVTFTAESKVAGYSCKR